MFWCKIISGKEKITEILGWSDEISYPVAIGKQYIAKITAIKNNVIPIAIISDFECEIPKAKLGDKVKFRVKEIIGDYCRAELIETLEKETQSVVVQSVTVQSEKKDLVLATKQPNCLGCTASVEQTFFDNHEGLCRICYYQSVMKNIAIKERRSGIYGSDRAGTY